LLTAEFCTSQAQGIYTARLENLVRETKTGNEQPCLINNKLAYAYANGIVLTEALVVRSGTIAVHLK
jgi:hypothetical protein